MKKGTSISFILILLLVLWTTDGRAEEIVNTKTTYTYEEMVKDIKALKESYPDLVTYKRIGKSHFGRDLWAVKIGKGDSVVFINGSHHAREWMTTTLVMKMMEYYLDGYQTESTIDGYHVKDMLEELSIWFVPMVNPDGVTLQQFGLSKFPEKHHKQLIKMNDNSRDFTRWKANAQGIDLNRQYPAGWNTTSGFKNPYWWNHNGSFPFQTNENKAIRNFTYEINPEMAISYHSSGRVLYWHYHNKKENYNRDYQLATTLGKKTGYALVAPNKNPGGKGYSDWFIKEFAKPAFTPEISYYVGNRHVPLSVFPEVWERNHSIGLWSAAEAYNLKYKSKNEKEFTETLNLTRNHNLYSSSSFNVKPESVLTPQTVQAVAKYRNWYKIKTEAGMKWIVVPQSLDHFPERTFLDVEKAYWSKDEIDFVKEKGWMMGNSPETFNPNGELTRAQMAVILVRILNIPIVETATSSFTDVSTKHWAYEYIETAKANNLFGGYGNGNFGPQDPIARDQMAVVLARLTKQSLEEELTEKPFEDIEITHWAGKEIGLMKQLTIFRGKGDGTFGGRDKTSRAQIAVLITRIQTLYPELFSTFLD